MSIKNSFTAASTLPFKVFRNTELMESLHFGIIPPIHVQFIPTNRCNLKCSFCSCSERDRTQEMDIEETTQLVHTLRSLGCQSVTITGGGEPLLHPNIQSIIELFVECGIKIGLVTNGLLLDKIGPVLSNITWCRISCADERPLGGRTEKGMAFLNSIYGAVTKAPNVDWAFSYVLAQKPNFGNVRQHIFVANELHFTHVRVVSDLLDIAHSPIDSIKEKMEPLLDTSKVIWQGRKEHTVGRERCLISLLKPVIGPDGLVYPCCGVQYALSTPSLDLPQEMSMGHWGDLSQMNCFDGSHCVTCYYDSYNTSLAAIIEDIQHLEFV